MNLIDDAPSTRLCRLGEQETIWAAVGFYVYVREPTAKERLHGTSLLTQFGRMCEQLGIKSIAAGSPEGRSQIHSGTVGAPQRPAVPQT